MIKFSTIITLQYNTVFSPFTYAEWKHGLDWIKNEGLDGVELCISNYENIDVPAIKEELDKRGLSCSTLSTGQARELEGLSLIGVPSNIVKKTQERLKEHIDAASILKSKVTIGLIRGVGSNVTHKINIENLRETMLPLVDYAQKKGVTIVLEAINRYETSLLNSSEDALDFIVNQLGNPDNVGILWDLFHANIEDSDFYESVHLMRNKLKHIHIADSNRMFPGYGHTNFEKIFRTVKQSGYNEYASFECFNKPSLEIVLKNTGKWVDKIRLI